MKQILILLTFLFLTSCAQRIKVPMNRFLSPEAMGGGFQVEYQDTGLSSAILDFSNGSTSNPLVVGTVRNESIYTGLSLSKDVDAFIKIHKESSSLLGLKVQVMGAPFKATAIGHNLSFSLAGGSERDTFKDDFEITLKSDITDYSLVHGYRFSPSLLMYEGVSLSNYSFRGKVKGDTTLDDDEINYSARNILGAHIGVIYGSQGFNLKVEWATQKIVWTNTEEKIFSTPWSSIIPWMVSSSSS